MNTEYKNQIIQICKEGAAALEEPMKGHTTFRIGGPAEIMAQPATEEEILGVLTYCNENRLPLFILGNGSNLLVSDKGIRGVVLQIYRNYDDVEVQGNVIRARSGALLSRVAQIAAEHSLGGLEFASGIPGTIGGGAAMNAGAYGGEMKDVITEVRYADLTGQVHVAKAEELDFGYRTSRILKEGAVVLEVTIVLEKKEQEAIYGRMAELREQRTSKQPLEYPSAGSTFKRPEGYFAGKLIQDAGLRGYRVGDAQVSEKHCGFVINRGAATAQQVLQLVTDVQREVKNRFGVDMEMEVRLAGEF